MIHSYGMTVGLDLLVMAAGLSKRYGINKQLDRFGRANAVISEYAIFDALKNGVDRVVFILNECIKSSFYDHMAYRLSSYCEVDFVIQSNLDCFQDYQYFTNRSIPWGTGHAILCAREKLRGNFLVVNGDDFYGFQPIALSARFIKHIPSYENIFCCAGYSLKKTLSSNGVVSRGICEMDSYGNLISIKEVSGIQMDMQGEIPNFGPIENAVVSMNLFAFTPVIFQYLDEEWRRFLDEHRFSQTEEFFITTAINNMLKKKLIEMKVFKTDAQWAGVTYRDDKKAVDEKINNLIDSDIYPIPLWQ
jgi:UTP-glucose-1-phosphate uridylyltransferase